MATATAAPAKISSAGSVPMGAGGFVSSLVAHQYLERLNVRERQMRRSNLLRSVAGLVIIATVLAVLPWCIVKAGHFFEALPANDARSGIATWQWIVIDAAVLLMTFPLAVLTHKESRADAVRRFMDSGGGAHESSGDDLLVWFVLMSGCLGLLQGEFLLIDAMKLSRLRFRLINVDRRRAAMILARLMSEPAGFEPHRLLQPGETTGQFRRTIGYLMAYEWVDISPKGDHLMLLSPARRALRG